jgi:hypothetical protein
MPDWGTATSPSRGGDERPRSALCGQSRLTVPPFVGSLGWTALPIVLSSVSVVLAYERVGLLVMNQVVSANGCISTYENGLDGAFRRLTSRNAYE